MLQYIAVHRESRAANFKVSQITQPVFIGYLLWARHVEYHDEEDPDLALTQLYCICEAVVGTLIMEITL